MMWRRNFTYNYYSWYPNTVTTVATGAYIASSSSASTACGLWSTCTIGTAWNYFTYFNSTMCSSAPNAGGLSNYQMVGQYGFCSGPDGTYSTASTILAIQGTMIAGTVLLFFAAISAIAGPSSGSKAGWASVGLSLIAAALCTAAFSLAVSFSWYKSFGSTGGYLPFIAYSGNQAQLAIMPAPIVLYWGPAFTSTVIASFIAWCAVIVMAMSSRQLDEDLDGTYGAGAGGMDGGGMAYGGGQPQYGQAPAPAYGYTVDKA
jgi:hypothetical protein